MQAAGERNILVTGASSGIGREIAIQSAAPGVSLWLFGRDSARLNEIGKSVREKGADATLVEIDLRDLDAVDQYLKRNFPPEVRVDRLYLAAAITAFGEVHEMLAHDWDQLYRMNLLSPLQMTRHFYGNMVGVGGGRIVLISSLAAYAGYPTATAYATMKAGLLGLHRSLWQEGRTHGVSIHHVSLGYVRTGIYRAAVYRKTDYRETMDSIRKLGLPMISAESAARGIIAKVDRGLNDFAVPFYASMMKWIAPRFPAVITLVHARIMRIFHHKS